VSRPDLPEGISLVDPGELDPIGQAIEDGLAVRCESPAVGVAVWLHRPALGASMPLQQPPAAVAQARARMGPEGRARAEAFRAVLRQQRELARPGEHAYLDLVGVLPEHRRWADRIGLSCFLDTMPDEHVAFYRNRGNEVVSEARSRA
jgi:hypothetical protein